MRSFLEKDKQLLQITITYKIYQDLLDTSI